MPDRLTFAEIADMMLDYENNLPDKRLKPRLIHCLPELEPEEVFPFIEYLVSILEREAPPLGIVAINAGIELGRQLERRDILFSIDWKQA